MAYCKRFSLVSTGFTPAMLNADVVDVVRQFGCQNGARRRFRMQSVEARSLFMIFSPEVFGVKKVFAWL